VSIKVVEGGAALLHLPLQPFFFAQEEHFLRTNHLLIRHN